jgi:site-specific DNA-methyltransferase (adenine-specific)
MTYLSHINIDEITAAIQVRKTTGPGVERMMRSLQERGYLDRYPVAVTPTANGYKLLDGNHRVEAARRLEVARVPAQVYEDLAPNDEYRIAYESNAGHDAVVPQDWTDNAEFIWSLAGLGKPQAEIAEIMGWNVSLVKQYSALRGISSEAWQIVVVTTKAGSVTAQDSDAVTTTVTPVTGVFTENLLRSITSLTAEQQLWLVKSLAAGKMDKSQFKAAAEKAKARNGWRTEAARRLKDLPDEYLERAYGRIDKGAFDKETMPSEAFEKLIQHLLKDYADEIKQSYHVASITHLIDILEPNSVDLILTDPPYEREFLPVYEDLAKLAAHVLKLGGSLMVMVGQSYLPEILALMTPHMRYHWELTYLTPGGQAVQLWERKVNTFWKPVLWFVKGEYNGKWLGDVARSNVNDNDKRFHQWGQSESGMADLFDRVANQGDVILDPFLGGGTTGVVAVSLGHEFIGADIDAATVETARQCIHEARSGR